MRRHRLGGIAATEGYNYAGEGCSTSLWIVRSSSVRQQASCAHRQDDCAVGHDGLKPRRYTSKVPLGLRTFVAYCRAPLMRRGSGRKAYTALGDQIGKRDEQQHDRGRDGDLQPGAMLEHWHERQQHGDRYRLVA
jgi:hypothetical protein